MHEPFFRSGKAVANVTAKYKLSLTSYEFFRPSEGTASAHKEGQGARCREVMMQRGRLPPMGKEDARHSSHIELWDFDEGDYVSNYKVLRRYFTTKPRKKGQSPCILAWEILPTEAPKVGQIVHPLKLLASLHQGCRESIYKALTLKTSGDEFLPVVPMMCSDGGQGRGRVSSSYNSVILTKLAFLFCRTVLLARWWESSCSL